MATAADGLPLPLPIVRTAEEWTDFKPQQIFNRKYAYEEVLLDGKNYVNCEFLHVSLFYDGTAPTAMTNCQFDPDTIQHFHSHNPAMAQMVEIIRSLRMLKDGIQFGLTPLPRDR